MRTESETQPAEARRVWRISEPVVIGLHTSSPHSPNGRFVIALRLPDGTLETEPTLCRPEKKAAKLAFQLNCDTFSKSGLSVRHPELRAFQAIVSGKLRYEFGLSEQSSSPGFRGDSKAKDERSFGDSAQWLSRLDPHKRFAD